MCEQQQSKNSQNIAQMKKKITFYNKKAILT